MSEVEAVLLEADIGPIMIEDPILARLDSAAADSPRPYVLEGTEGDVAAGGPAGDVVAGGPAGEVAAGGPAGDVAAGGPAEGPPAQDEEDPYKLEVIKPRALDLRILYELAGRSVPGEIEAALGATVPVLLYHGMTAFRQPGQGGGGLRGLGYESRLKDQQGDTVSVSPDTRVKQFANLDQEIRVGIKAGGELEVPNEALQVVKLIPGVNLHGVELQVTNDTRFGLAIQFQFSIVEVQAGPIDPGGARWNLYRDAERLDRFQPLIQTLLLPDAVPSLDLEVNTWLRSRSGLFGLGASQWNYPTQTFTVELEGLNPQP